MTTPTPPGLRERLGTWLLGQPAPPPKAKDMLNPVTQSVPLDLLLRVKQRAYDPKLIELFQMDSLARQKGWGVYEDMLDDSQVRAVTTIKRYAPTSNGWKINPADETPQATEIAELIRDNFLDMERSLETVVGQALESTFTGLSVSEQLWRVERRGKYRGKILLQDVQTRPPSVVDVNFDGAGQITGVLQATSLGGWDDVGIHPFKFIIHTWDGRYGSPYGRGDGRSVYKHWWAKDFLMRAWAIYMDKFGAPSLIGRQGPNMSQEDLSRFEDLLKYVQHEGYSIMPKEWEFDWLFPPGGSSNPQAFLTAIEWHDSMIAKAVLGSTLSTDENRGTGTFAQAKVHEATRDLLLRRVKTEAETVIVTNQIIKRLVRLNYGSDAARTLCPKFVFSPPDLGEMKDLADIISSLVTAKVISAEEPWIRERLYIPAHEEVHDATQKIAEANASKDAAVQATVTPPDAPAAPAGPDPRHLKLLDAALARVQQRHQHQLGQQAADAAAARTKQQAVLQAALARAQQRHQHQLGQQAADAGVARGQKQVVLQAALARAGQRSQHQLGQQAADAGVDRARRAQGFTPDQKNRVRTALQNRLKGRGKGDQL